MELLTKQGQTQMGQNSRPRTCDDCSAPLQISLMGKNEISQPSGFIAEVISSALLTNLVKLNPPTLV